MTGKRSNCVIVSRPNGELPAMSDGPPDWQKTRQPNDGGVSAGKAQDAERPESETSPLKRFEYLGEVGSGGSGSVHRVKDRNLLRVVAMKTPDPKHSRKNAGVERFMREARIHAHLDHPNIVPVHELVTSDDGPLFFIMKLVDGSTLRAWIRDVGRPAGTVDQLHEMLLAFLKMCDAVAVAHSRSIVHCDLKPENVMVGSFGQVYVMDWGLARVVHESAAGGDAGITPDSPFDTNVSSKGGVTGTPAYMSPEQAKGRDELVSERTDVFGLGTILYSILTGKPPYDGRDVGAVLAQARACKISFPTPKPDEHIPRQLCLIARKAMARLPKDRYASVLELKRAVECFLRGGFTFASETYTAGEKIVVEGEPGDRAFIITKGTCVVYKGTSAEKRVLRTLEAGGVFGEMAVLTGGTRTASVEAVGDVELKVVTREALEANLGLDGWFGAFVRVLAERFREMEERISGEARGRNDPM